MAGYAQWLQHHTQSLQKQHFNLAMSVSAATTAICLGLLLQVLHTTVAASDTLTATAVFQFIWVHCGCSIRYNHHYNNILVCMDLWMPYTADAASDTLTATTAFNST